MDATVVPICVKLLTGASATFFINCELEFLGKKGQDNKVTDTSHVGFIILFCFIERVSVCSLGWPRSQYVNQAGLELTEL